MPSRDSSAPVISHLPEVSCFGFASASAGRRACRGASSRRARRGTRRGGCRAGTRTDEPPPAARLAHPRVVVQRSMTRVLPVSGSSVTIPAILVVGGSRAGDRQLAVVRHDGHRPADVALGLLGAARARACSAAGAAGVGGFAGSPASCDRRREAAVGPRGLAGLEIQDREQPAILRVADVGAAGDVFGVAALGDVVRHDGVLRAGGPLGDEHEHVRVVGRRASGRPRSADPAARAPAACPSCLSPRPSSCPRSVLSEKPISFSSSSRMNFWLSVSRGSGFFGPTSVSCVTSAGSPLSSGTMNRLPSRT